MSRLRLGSHALYAGRRASVARAFEHSGKTIYRLTFADGATADVEASLVQAAKPKRGYSRDFTPRSDTYGRYLLDKIPAELWRTAKARARRDGISIRAVLLLALREWSEKAEATR